MAIDQIQNKNEDAQRLNKLNDLSNIDYPTQSKLDDTQKSTIRSTRKRDYDRRTRSASMDRQNPRYSHVKAKLTTRLIAYEKLGETDHNGTFEKHEDNQNLNDSMSLRQFKFFKFIF